MKKGLYTLTSDVYTNLVLVSIVVLLIRVFVSPYVPYVWNAKLFLIPLLFFGVLRLVLK